MKVVVLGGLDFCSLVVHDDKLGNTYSSECDVAVMSYEKYAVSIRVL
jgi:hypothetical protein